MRPVAQRGGQLETFRLNSLCLKFCHQFFSLFKAKDQEEKGSNSMAEAARKRFGIITWISVVQEVFRCFYIERLMKMMKTKYK